MPNRQRSRDSAAHLHPPVLPQPAEVWRMRQTGERPKEIAARYGVSVSAVYHSLAKYRIKYGHTPGQRRNFYELPTAFPITR